MEGDAVEIKNEPKSNYDSTDPKISDGIDHSGLCSELLNARWRLDHVIGPYMSSISKRNISLGRISKHV